MRVRRILLAFSSLAVVAAGQSLATISGVQARWTRYPRIPGIFLMAQTTSATRTTLTHSWCVRSGPFSPDSPGSGEGM